MCGKKICQLAFFHSKLSEMKSSELFRHLQRLFNCLIFTGNSHWTFTSAWQWIQPRQY